MKTHYTECICRDKGHIMRVIYDSHYKEYYIEYSLNKFAGITSNINKSPLAYNHIINKIHFIKCYLINLWHSIKGLPNTYTADIIFNKPEALKLAHFLIERK